MLTIAICKGRDHPRPLLLIYGATVHDITFVDRGFLLFFFFSSTQQSDRLCTVQPNHGHGVVGDHDHPPHGFEKGSFLVRTLFQEF